MKAQKLQKLCQNRALVRIERSIPNTNAMYGFLLRLSRNLVLMHDLYDFHLDGYSIIKRTDISNVRHSKYERYFQKILKSEGVLEQVGLEEEILLGSWQSVFRSLKRIGRNIIIEGEDPDLDEFVIGRVIRVNKRSITIHEFDATGKWIEEPWNVPYEYITRIRFDSEYIQVFSKYLH